MFKQEIVIIAIFARETAWLKPLLERSEIVKIRPSVILQIILLNGVRMQQGSTMPAVLKYWRCGNEKQHIDITKVLRTHIVYC